MSKFLAPIHSWLFNKIRIQENLELKLYSLINKGEEIKEEAEEKYGTLTPKGDLKDLIDEGNIHGWLQERINASSKRLAYLLQAAVNGGMEEEVLLRAFNEEGQRIGKDNKDQVVDPSTAFKLMNDVVLDGMPCDMVNRIVSEDDKGLVFEKTKDIHSPLVAGIVSMDLYQGVRMELIKGLMEANGMAITRVGNNFIIRRP